MCCLHINSIFTYLWKNIAKNISWHVLDELEKMLQASTVAWFKALSHYLPGEIDEKPQSEQQTWDTNPKHSE